MIQIPLSQSGPADQFAKAVEAHRAALVRHQMGKTGIAAPAAPSQWVEQVIARQPQTGPVETRGPDQFVILPYEIVDDAPQTPEAEQAISILRETINQGA